MRREVLMALEDNKALVRRYFDEVWSQGKLAVVPELVGRDWVPSDGDLNFQPREGTSGIRAFVSAYRQAYPDLTLTVRDIIAEGNEIVTFFTAEGTHSGEFAGHPPTGQRVREFGVS